MQKLSFILILIHFSYSIFSNGMIYINSLGKIERPQILPPPPLIRRKFSQIAEHNALESGFSAVLETVTKHVRNEVTLFVNLDFLDIFTESHFRLTICAKHFNRFDMENFLVHHTYEINHPEWHIPPINFALPSSSKAFNAGVYTTIKKTSVLPLIDQDQIFSSLEYSGFVVLEETLKNFKNGQNVTTAANFLGKVISVVHPRKLIFKERGTEKQTTLTVWSHHADFIKNLEVGAVYGVRDGRPSVFRHFSGPQVHINCNSNTSFHKFGANSYMYQQQGLEVSAN